MKEAIRGVCTSPSIHDWLERFWSTSFLQPGGVFHEVALANDIEYRMNWLVVAQPLAQEPLPVGFLGPRDYARCEDTEMVSPVI